MEPIVYDPTGYHCSNGRGLTVVTEPNLLRIADYWRSKRHGRSMPSRRDIDPVEIPWALSKFFMVDYERDTDTFRYRLAGTDIENVFTLHTRQNSMKGLTLEDTMPPNGLAVVQKRWRPLAENGHIVYMKGLVYLAAERVPIGARLMLPTADGDDGVVTGLIGYTECSWQGPHEFNEVPGIDVWYVPLCGLDGLPALDPGVGEDEQTSDSGMPDQRRPLN